MRVNTVYRDVSRTRYREMCIPGRRPGPRSRPLKATLGCVASSSGSSTWARPGFELRSVDGFPGGVRCPRELDEQDVKRLVDRQLRWLGNSAGARRAEVRSANSLAWMVANRNDRIS